MHFTKKMHQVLKSIAVEFGNISRANIFLVVSSREQVMEREVINSGVGI